MSEWGDVGPGELDTGAAEYAGTGAAEYGVGLADPDAAAFAGGTSWEDRVAPITCTGLTVEVQPGDPTMLGGQATRPGIWSNQAILITATFAKNRSYKDGAEIDVDMWLDNESQTAWLPPFGPGEAVTATWYHDAVSPGEHTVKGSFEPLDGGTPYTLVNSFSVLDAYGGQGPAVQEEGTDVEGGKDLTKQAEMRGLVKAHIQLTMQDVDAHNIPGLPLNGTFTVSLSGESRQLAFNEHGQLAPTGSHEAYTAELEGTTDGNGVLNFSDRWVARTGTIHVKGTDQDGNVLEASAAKAYGIRDGQLFVLVKRMAYSAEVEAIDEEEVKRMVSVKLEAGFDIKVVHVGLSADGELEKSHKTGSNVKFHVYATSRTLSVTVAGIEESHT